MRRRTRECRLAAICGAIAVAMCSNPAESGQETGHTNPPLVIASMSGRDLFEFYCASCHGRDGKGAGPTAPALKTLPPDLTTIARRHGGTFPKADVEAFVTNARPLDTRGAHGSKDMPVWGPIFRGLDAHDAMNRARLDALVAHLAAMQQK